MSSASYLKIVFAAMLVGACGSGGDSPGSDGGGASNRDRIVVGTNFEFEGRLSPRSGLPNEFDHAYSQKFELTLAEKISLRTSFQVQANDCGESAGPFFTIASASRGFHLTTDSSSPSFTPSRDLDQFPGRLVSGNYQVDVIMYGRGRCQVNYAAYFIETDEPIPPLPGQLDPFLLGEWRRESAHGDRGTIVATDTTIEWKGWRGGRLQKHVIYGLDADGQQLLLTVTRVIEQDAGQPARVGDQRFCLYQIVDQLTEIGLRLECAPRGVQEFPTRLGLDALSFFQKK